METPVALVVMGTRPEAIKLAPVIEALRRQGRLTPLVVSTAQHRQMLPQALAPFGIVPDQDLDVMASDQTATQIAREVMAGLEPLLPRVRPAWTVVQGDTTTAFAAAVTSFYAGVPVAHVEAGLRTGRMDAPFPEEFNRRSIAVAASLHLAPTPRAREQLLGEGFEPDGVVVVGNTVVDAVASVLARAAPAARDEGPPRVLLTVHRRESFGAPMVRVLEAIRLLAQEYRGRVRWIYPVHPNPNVESVARSVLSGAPGVELVAPLDYPGFLRLFAEARFVMTDSGGVQEEAAAVGTPVLVLREVTERPELIESGWGRLVGTEAETILAEARRLLDSDAEVERMTRRPNPFGDGRSGERIATELARRLGL